jgi:hypothetical protein
MYCYSVGALLIPARAGGNNVVYAVGYGKESLAGSLLTSSMLHVEGMFCIGRRGGEIGDGGSDLSLFVYSCRGDKRVGRCWTCEDMGWWYSWWLFAIVYYCVGVILAMRAMECKVSGGGCNVGVLRFSLLMLISPMGWSLGYMSSHCSEDFWWCLF